MKSKVRFQSLQDNLRAWLWARLERGEITGKGLARRAGFQQAHLSNFLNGKRGLSLQAMDRLLDLLHIDVLHLAGVSDVERPAAETEPGDEAQRVPLVSLEAAANLARFTADDIQEVVSYSRSLLRQVKAITDGNRRDWTRFVAVRADRHAVAGMAPLLQPEAMLLLDRHHNAPPLHPADQGLYLALDEGRCVLRRLTPAPGALILRPLTESASAPVRLVQIPVGKRAGHFIVGRVRHIAMQV